MKREWIVFAIILMIAIRAEGHEYKLIKLSQTPVETQTFINTHFAQCQIAIAKQETEWLETIYNIVFTDGSKLEFDKHGQWKTINCSYTHVPMSIIPSGIQEYLKHHHKELQVILIERTKERYYLKLSDGENLNFDLHFNLIQ